MLTLNDIISSLTSLTRAERAILKKAIEELDPPVLSDDTQWLYDAAARLLGERMPYKAFLMSSFANSWKVKSLAAIEFLDTTFPTISKTARLGLAQMLLQALFIHLKDKGLTPSMGVVATHLDLFPSLFDEAFPNYRMSGMAHLVIGAMKRAR